MICGFIKGQELTLTTPVIADGTIDYLTAQFVFSSKDWEGLKIYAHFIQGTTHFVVELENGKIAKDKHLNLTQGEWAVYLHGNVVENDEVKMRITTEPKTITVVASGAEGGDVFPEMSGDAGEQILAKADYAVEMVEQLKKDSYVPKNKKTLEGLYCAEVEEPFSQTTDNHYLKNNGRALRYVSDGAVIGSVEPVEENGKQFLRLNLFDGRALVFGDVFPDFVDIPVSAIVEKEEVKGDIILNGSELELPSGGGGGSSVTVDADGYIVIG